jgi:tyrosyl-tRNA synthetase
MIIPGFEIATNVDLDKLTQVKKDLESGRNPKELKMLLAHTFVEMCHGAKEADSAEKNFKQVFESGFNPEEILEIKVTKKNILDILEETKLASSKSDARRLIKQGGVKIDGKKLDDENLEIGKMGKDGMIIQKGKRFFVKLVN